MDTQALIEAAESGATNTVEQLLKSGVDANARPNNGTTALIRAASNNHVETVRVLLDNGADINATRNDGMTPLILAAFFGHIGVADLLLERGADLNARDQLGSTALQWASSRGHKETFELLKKASPHKVKTPTPTESIETVVVAAEEAEKPLPPVNTQSAQGENPLGYSFEMNVLELNDPAHSNFSDYTSDDEPSELDELDADFDETTIVTPQITARAVPVAPPLTPPARPHTLPPPVAARKITPPATSSYRSNARLLMLAWLIIFSVTAALTYALTKSSSDAGSQPVIQVTQDQPAPGDNNSTTQNTQPAAALPPVENTEKGQPKLTSSVPTPSPVQFTGGQHAASANETDARERKSMSRDEAPQVVENTRREAASNEPENRPAAPKPTPLPKRDDDELRARTEAAAAPPRAPAQRPSPARNPEASSEPQSSRSNPSAPAQQKKKVIRWP